MRHIIVASSNPVKLQAANDGFALMFPETSLKVDGLSVQSGVRDQPYSDQETRLGAVNRANAARAQRPNADYWVGIEGGVAVMEDELMGFAWVVIVSKDMMGKSRTGTFFLPTQVKELVQQGVELGDADDMVFNRENSKQDIGAVGILTDNILNRTSYYTHAVVLALIPFKRKDLYQG